MITGGSAIRMTSLPGFGKTLFTSQLHNILNERNVENFDTAVIVFFLVPFILSPVLNTKKLFKNV